MKSEVSASNRGGRLCQTPIVNPPLVLLLILLVLMILIVRPTNAQQITLKTGQRVDTLGVRRDGDLIMGKVQVGSGSGEIGYNSSQIANINFPEPRGLKIAGNLLAQGQPEKALAEIEPVVKYYESFKEISGAWWSQAALIKVSALAALRREADAESLAAEIEKTATDPEIARAAKLRIASGLVRKNEFEKALRICDDTIKQSTDSQTLANAWLTKGDALFGEKSWDAALLAYLHVPVFYGDEKSFLPAALLGSARAYWRLDDASRAKKAFTDLIGTYPKSAEAAIAENEIKKIRTQ